MKKIRLLTTLAVIALLVLGAIGLSACNDEAESYTVTYYDGETVLKTETVESGKNAVEWTPVKDGYQFVDWFATPSFSHVFDFAQPITQNTSVFAQWQSATQSVDTRSFYIVGSGTSPILSQSNWGAVIGEDFKMTKAADSNTYTYTVDLFAGDLFQLPLTRIGIISAE